jgi:hypothetical protein
VTLNGADVAQLRAAATQFSRGASALEASSKALHSLIGNGTQWRGPDADRFRSEWSSVSVRAITAAVESLRRAADELRRHADQQDQASAVHAGDTVAARIYNAPDAPTGTAGLMQQIHKTDGSYDGLLIQQVVGEDGKSRFIVYFNGTDAADRLTKERNLTVAGGHPDDYITRRIDAALRAAGYAPGANGPEMMLVGFSQGGMDAQNIAHAHLYNVTDMVTYGSPLTHADDPDINTVHMRAKGDNIPDLPGEALALLNRDPIQAGLIRAGIIDGLGDKVSLNEPWSGPSQHIYEADSCTVDTDAARSFLWGNHAVKETYEYAGMDFDSSTDPALADEKASIARFRGDVVKSWDPLKEPPKGGAGW